MAALRIQRVRTWVVILALTTGTAACGSGDDKVSDEEVFGETSTSVHEGRGTGRKLDVGGHKLYMECRGRGLPTVVFLHGSVRERGSSGRERAGKIPDLLDDHNRVCVYDRANVGRSDSVPGPLTGRSSAKELHSLLASAGEHGPYVLLGASLGGAIADIYANEYPEQVTGMVLLDSTLPAYLDMYERLFPPGSGPKPNEWRNEAERLDRLTTFRQAGEFQRRRRAIPVTYIAAAVSLPPKITAAIRRAQRQFVSRFSPGRLIEVNVGHNMVPLIPEQIVREVRRVAADSKRVRARG